METVIRSAGDEEVVIYGIGKYSVAPSFALSTVLGDVLGNYRATLDHLAWALVHESGGEVRNPGQVHFPIHSESTNFVGQLPRRLPGVDPIALSIIERYQPFRVGVQASRHPMQLLNSWVNTDKHQIVTLAAAVSTEINVTIPAAFDNFVVRHQEVRNASLLQYLSVGTELLRFYGHRLDPRRDPGVRCLFQGRATIAHADGPYVEQTLVQIDSLVAQILAEVSASRRVMRLE
jgi:hypothetical protein